MLTQCLAQCMKYGHFPMVAELFTNLCSCHYGSVVNLDVNDCGHFSPIPSIYENAIISAFLGMVYFSPSNTCLRDVNHYWDQ